MPRLWLPQGRCLMAERRFKPFVSGRSPYCNTPLTGARPHFCVQPRALSSNVEIPPALLPYGGRIFANWFAMTQEVFLEIIDEVNGFIEQFLVLTTVHENRLCTEHLRHLSKDRSTALSNEPIRELTYQWVGSNTAEPVRTTALQTYAQLADRNFLTLVSFSLVVELPSISIPTSSSSPSTCWVTSNLMRSLS